VFNKGVDLAACSGAATRCLRCCSDTAAQAYGANWRETSLHLGRSLRKMTLAPPS
jgi:hypothetical protein